MENKNTMQAFFGEQVYSYTRKQAIEDGILNDVTSMAQEAGIKFPVAITIAVWNEYVKPCDELNSYGQSCEGRLWDILYMFRHNALKNASDLMYFELYFQMMKNGKPVEELVKLKAHIGPGDQGEPVITIMKPDED